MPNATIPNEGNLVSKPRNKHWINHPQIGVVYHTETDFMARNLPMSMGYLLDTFWSKDLLKSPRIPSGSTVLSGNRYLQFWWFIMVSHHFSQDLMARDWGILVPVDPVFRQIHIFYMLRRRYLMVINAIISSYNKDQQKSLRLGRLPSSLTSGNQAWLAGKSIIDSFPAINLHLVRGFPSWPRLMTPEGKSIHHQY